MSERTRPGVLGMIPPALLLLLSLGGSSSACLWYYGTNPQDLHRSQSCRTLGRPGL
jgi:hypothetical protein